VQYLHKTVKDYIESSEVQRKLGAAMQSPYDAHLRHCIGLLTALKSKPDYSQPLLLDKIFWSQVNSFFKYARGVQRQNQPQLHDLMDSLDSTCTHIAKRNITENIQASLKEWNEHKLYNWASLNPMRNALGPFNGHLLSLAVRCGLLDYVAGIKLDSACLVPARPISNKPEHQLFVREDKYPLLLDAVTWIGGGYWLTSTVPDLKMIAFLLENGADPNFSFSSDFCRTFTIWHAALAVPSDICFKNVPSSGEMDWRKWLQAYKLLIEHGAGQFSERARPEIIIDIDFMLDRALVPLKDWEDLVQRLMEGSSILTLYGNRHQIRNSDESYPPKRRPHLSPILSPRLSPVSSFPS
jgi:hypothetical protein